MELIWQKDYPSHAEATIERFCPKVGTGRRLQRRSRVLWTDLRGKIPRLIVPVPAAPTYVSGSSFIPGACVVGTEVLPSHVRVARDSLKVVI